MAAPRAAGCAAGPPTGRSSTIARRRDGARSRARDPMPLRYYASGTVPPGLSSRDVRARAEQARREAEAARRAEWDAQVRAVIICSLPGASKEADIMEAAPRVPKGDATESAGARGEAERKSAEAAEVESTQKAENGQSAESEGEAAKKVRSQKSKTDLTQRKRRTQEEARKSSARAATEVREAKKESRASLAEWEADAKSDAGRAAAELLERFKAKKPSDAEVQEMAAGLRAQKERKAKTVRAAAQGKKDAKDTYNEAVEVPVEAGVIGPCDDGGEAGEDEILAEARRLARQSAAARRAAVARAMEAIRASRPANSPPPTAGGGDIPAAAAPSTEGGSGEGAAGDGRGGGDGGMRDVLATPDSGNGTGRAEDGTVGKYATNNGQGDVHNRSRGGSDQEDSGRRSNGVTEDEEGGGDGSLRDTVPTPEINYVTESTEGSADVEMAWVDASEDDENDRNDRRRFDIPTLDAKNGDGDSVEDVMVGLENGDSAAKGLAKDEISGEDAATAPILHRTEEDGVVSAADTRVKDGQNGVDSRGDGVDNRRDDIPSPESENGEGDAKYSDKYEIAAKNTAEDRPGGGASCFRDAPCTPGLESRNGGTEGPTGDGVLGDGKGAGDDGPRENVPTKDLKNNTWGAKSPPDKTTGKDAAEGGQGDGVNGPRVDVSVLDTQNNDGGVKDSAKDGMAAECAADWGAEDWDKDGKSGKDTAKRVRFDEESRSRDAVLTPSLECSNKEAEGSAEDGIPGEDVAVAPTLLQGTEEEATAFREDFDAGDDGFPPLRVYFSGNVTEIEIPSDWSWPTEVMEVEEETDQEDEGGWWNGWWSCYKGKKDHDPKPQRECEPIDQAGVMEGDKKRLGIDGHLPGAKDDSSEESLSARDGTVDSHDSLVEHNKAISKVPESDVSTADTAEQDDDYFGDEEFDLDLQKERKPKNQVCVTESIDESDDSLLQTGDRKADSGRNSRIKNYNIGRVPDSDGSTASTTDEDDFYSLRSSDNSFLDNSFLEYEEMEDEWESMKLLVYDSISCDCGGLGPKFLLK